jgi:hypothetical protein
MIKKVEDWTFTEHQAHAKGYLEGILMGFILTLLLASIGIDLYFIFKS